MTDETTPKAAPHRWTHRWIEGLCLLSLSSQDLELLQEALQDLESTKNEALPVLKANGLPNVTESDVGLPKIRNLKQRVVAAYCAEPGK